MKAVILKGIVVEDSLLCGIDVIEAPSAHLHHGVERPNEMYLITPTDEIKHNLDIRNQAGVLPKTDGTELIFMDKQLISSVYKELDIKTLISLIDYVNQNGKLSKRKLNKSERKEMEKFTGGCDHFREASEDLLKQMKDNFLWVEAKMFPVNKPYIDVKQLKQAHVIIAATGFVEKEVGGVVGVEICPPSELMYLVPSPEQFDLITLNDKIKGILEKRNDSGSLPKTEGNELVFIHNTLINILYNDSDKVNNITMRDHINTPNCHLQSAPVANSVLDLYGDVKHVCSGLWSYVDQDNNGYLIGPLKGTTSNQEYDAIIGSCKRAGAKINLSYDESNVWNNRIKSPVNLYTGCIAVDLLNIGYGRITLDKEGICRLELKDKQPVRIMTTGFEDGMIDFLQNHFMVLEVYYGPLHTVIVNKLFNYACVLSNREIKDVIKEKVVLNFWELASHTVKVKDGDVTVPVEDSRISSKYHVQVDDNATRMYPHSMNASNIVSPVREGNFDRQQPTEKGGMWYGGKVGYKLNHELVKSAMRYELNQALKDMHLAPSRRSPNHKVIVYNGNEFFPNCYRANLVLDKTTMELIPELKFQTLYGINSSYKALKKDVKDALDSICPAKYVKDCDSYDYIVTENVARDLGLVTDKDAFYKINRPIKVLIDVNSTTYDVNNLSEEVTRHCINHTDLRFSNDYIGVIEDSDLYSVFKNIQDNLSYRTIANKWIKNCVEFIPIFTESYIKSQKCNYEIKNLFLPNRDGECGVESENIIKQEFEIPVQDPESIGRGLTTPFVAEFDVESYIANNIAVDLLAGKDIWIFGKNRIIYNVNDGEPFLNDYSRKRLKDKEFLLVSERDNEIEFNTLYSIGDRKVRPERILVNTLSRVIDSMHLTSKNYKMVNGNDIIKYIEINENLDINQPDETDVTPVEENGIKSCEGIKVVQEGALLLDAPKVLVVMDGRASWEFLAATVNIKLFVGDRILNKPMDSLVEERSKTYQEFTIWCLNKLLDKTVRDSVTEIYFDDKAFEEFGQSMKKSATIATEDVQYKDGKFVKVELNSDEAK